MCPGSPRCLFTQRLQVFFEAESIALAMAPRASFEAACYRPV
jgi:hypothetical protein